MSELLKHTSHRPYPPPEKPHVGRMRWHDLLFAHWAVNPEDVRRALPGPLRDFLDVREGTAYVAVTPFWMSDVTGRWLPPLPGISTFPELNVRTYVTVNGMPGVFFFSLDAGNLSAVMGARMMYSLPYFHARMSVISDRHIGVRVEQHQPVDGEVSYFSERLEPPLPAQFRARYKPAGPVFNPQPGSLEYFLTERYALYTTRKGEIMRAHIHHLPWPLQPAQASIEVNTMAPAEGLVLPHDEPLLHFAKELEVVAWWPEKV